MLFSVVVPVYNVEKYLLECLNSIANQTFDDYEVILVDDGSTDSSGKICDDFCATHNKFKVFHKQNEGLLKTRLFGRTKMNGEYMISVDSDDFIAANSFEILNNYIEKYNRPDIICFNKYLLYMNNVIQKPSDSIDDFYVFTNDNKEQLLKDVFTSSKYNNLVTKAIKISLIQTDDTDYSKFCPNQGEDFVQSVYAFVNSKKTIIISDYLYYYRINNSSITRKIIDLASVDKYNLKALFELILNYINNNYRFLKKYCSQIIKTSIIYNIKLYLKMLIATSNKKEYNDIINYDWSKYYLNGGKISSKDLDKLNFCYKVAFKAILKKKRVIIYVMYKVYKMKFKRHGRVLTNEQ